MKATRKETRWASLDEAAALVLLGWRVLSYGTGPALRSVLLQLEA